MTRSVRASSSQLEFAKTFSMPRLIFQLMLFTLSLSVEVNAQQEARLFEQTDNQAIPAVKHWNKYFRLGVTVYPCSDGLHIKTVDPTGPGARLQPVSDPNSRASLEPDDHITKIDGIRVNTVDELILRLGQSGGQAVLTVLDKNTGKEFDYIASSESDDLVLPDSRNHEIGKVVTVLIGLTDDEKLSDSIKMSMNQLETIMREGLPQDELLLRTITGTECNARTILKSIDDVPADPTDTLFVYYLGHGAYDSRYAAGDPSGGHYMQIPSGDILRRTITNRMLAKRCRLTVFVSDTCNVEYESNNLFKAHAKTYNMTSEDFLPLEKLFLFHSGFLDVSGSSRDQYGWFHPAYGGFFTHSFSANLPAASSWNTLIADARDRTNALFQSRKQSALNSQNILPQMRDQTAQTPTAFQNTVKPLPFPRTGKQFTVGYSDGEITEVTIE